jgi:hypothetical protein
MTSFSRRTFIAVGFWLGFWFWWEHPGAELGRFFCLPGRGGHLGGPATKWGGRERPAGHAAVPPAALTFVPGRAAGAVFFSGGGPSEISGWIEPAGSAGLGPAKIKKGVPLRLEILYKHTDLPI